MDIIQRKAKLVYLNRLKWQSENTNSGVLHAAIGSNDIDRVRELILKDPKLVNGSSNQGVSQTPIFTAVFNGHAEILELLLEKGASSSIRDTKGSAVLNIAAVNRQVECVRLLLQYGADVNIETPDKAYYSFTPLHAIARSISQRGCDDAARNCVNLLLAHGGDPARRFENDQTAEEIAAELSTNLSSRPG